MKFSEEIMGWLMPILFVMLAERQVSTDSIRLQYGGPQDKSIPTLVFYVDSLDKTGLFRYTYRSYKLKEKCLESMAEKIKEFDSALKIENINSVGYYNFIINKNGLKTTYVTSNKINSQHLIYSLIQSIEDSVTKQKVLIKFNEISYMMW